MAEDSTKLFYLGTREFYDLTIKTTIHDYKKLDRSKETGQLIYPEDLPTTGWGCLSVFAVALSAVLETPFAIMIEGPIDLINRANSKKHQNKKTSRPLK